MNKILLAVVALSLAGCSKPDPVDGTSGIQWIECKRGVEYYATNKQLAPVFNKEGKVVLCGDQHE